MTNPITRRSALRTGALAAVAASLTIGAPDAPVVLAQPALAPVVHTDDLAAECRRLFGEYQEYRTEAFRLEEQLSPMLTAEQAELLRRFSDATTNGQATHDQWQAAELARHLPGLASAIRMIWEHTIGVAYQNPGACCTVDAGFEA